MKPWFPVIQPILSGVVRNSPSFVIPAIRTGMGGSVVVRVTNSSLHAHSEQKRRKKKESVCSRMEPSRQVKIHEGIKGSVVSGKGGPHALEFCHNNRKSTFHGYGASLRWE